MKNKKNRKKKLAIATIVATLLLIAAGTYAFTAYTEWVKNHFQSSGMEEGKVTIVEEFTPPNDLAPNGEYKKDVSIVNTGAGKYLVRVSFEEGSSRLGLTVDGTAKGTATAVVQSKTAGPVEDYFPVILNTTGFSTTYVTPDASNTDTTSVAYNAANFSIETTDDKGVKTTAKNADPDLKLLISVSDNKKGILVKEVKVKQGDFPKEDFTTDQITDSKGAPVVFADATTEVTVYQKVNIDNGDIERNTSTGAYTITGDITYSQFNTSFTKSSSNVQGDWTDTNAIVTDATHAGRLASTDFTSDANYTYATSKVDPQVTLKLNKDLVSDFATVTVPAAAGDVTKKWAYNPADGYFYYLDVLTSDKANNTTPSVLQKVKFGSSDVNLLSSYNLYVGLEAIPADVEALTLPATEGVDVSDKSKTTWTAKTGNGWDLKTATQKSVIDYYTKLIGLK